MKKRTLIPFVVALLAVLGVWLTGCDEEKTYDVVIGANTCPDSVFHHNDASEVFTDTIYVAAGDHIDEVLEENGYSRDSIKRAILNGAYYTVTDWVPPDPPQTDWTITGTILIQRTDVLRSEVPLIEYSEASVKGALNKRVRAKLHRDGVGVVNEALADFLDGANPAFRLVVLNGDCVPNPDESNRITFDWYACLQLQLVGETTTKVFQPL